MTDNASLRGHGGNLAAVLHRLETEDRARFRLICRQIRRVLPSFDTFVLEAPFGKVSLRWKARHSDKTFGTHLTSDSSLRCFALITLLNLPAEMLPDVILLDEPELGLHPTAVELVAEMVKEVGRHQQVMLATQSPMFVDAFGLDRVVVLDLDQEATGCCGDSMPATMRDGWSRTNRPGDSGARTFWEAGRDPRGNHG